MSWKQQNCAYEETRIVHPWAKYPWRQSYVVWVITGATFLCFLAINISPGLYNILGMSCGSNFRIWQLLSTSFIEGCILNLLSALILQLMFGVPLEHEWSPRHLAVVYLLSGIGSNLLLLTFLPQGACFGSTAGAVSGLLAAAWYNLRDDEKWSLFMIAILSLRKIIMVIMIVTILLCLLSPAPILVIVPISGFALGSLYCLLQKKLKKKLQKWEGSRHKIEKKRTSNIEID